MSAAPQPLDESERVHRQLQPEEIESPQLPNPVSSATVDPALEGATGKQEISVVLKSSPADNDGRRNVSTGAHIIQSTSRKRATSLYESDGDRQKTRLHVFRRC